MNKLIAELKKLSLKFPLHEYQWEIPANVPITFPEGINANFSQNIFLKENFSCYLQCENLINHYWLIQQWGKIGSFKKNDRNDINIVEFIERLNSKQLTKKLFNLISSLSKVASYLDHRNYAIYDSRAIYSLNWLIFCNSQEKILYPQPSGRSSELAKYDMQTIFRLSKEKHSYFRIKLHISAIVSY